MDCSACHHANHEGSRFCAKCGVLLPVPNAESDPLINTVVGGRYRIASVLGEGGMGRVYTGEQQMGTKVRKVAVKTLLAEFARQPETVARFMRECGTVSELEHPNTIKVYDFGQTPSGDLYIAMELLTGRSLEEELVKSGAITPERVDRIIGQVCGSLQEAHDKGIIHRDLKPANIFLTTRAGEEDYVKVLDFGIAKRSEGSDAQEQKLTQQGKILGTPPYMSPEQFVGKELDARSDIYSLGVLAYEMLTGRLPFEADTPWAWATQHMTAQPFPFETVPLGASVPPKMKAATMRALQKDREKRQQTARELFEELTMGSQRLSGLGGGRPSSGSFPEASAGGGAAAAAMPEPRAGQTQVGEPLFIPTAGPGATAPGRTMVDQAPQVVVASVPTGGGQAFPAPPPAKKGGTGPIIAIVGAVVVVGAIVGIAFAVKGSKSGDGGSETIGLPSGAPTTTVASDPTAPTDTAGVNTAKPVNTAGKVPITNPSAKPTTDPGGAGDSECDAAINLARGNNTALAVNHFRSCPSTSPKRSAALGAIDASAQKEVSSKGCAAKDAARAAASVGAGAANAALKAKKCR